LKNFILFTAILLLKGFYTTAQETTVIKNHLTDAVTERITVLKSDKQTKQGLYQALYNKTALASGLYNNNDKAGTWHYYDTKGRLMESIDYTNNKLLYEEPVSKISVQYIQYKFDHKFSDTDKVSKPIKLGGRCFGYIPFMQFYHLPDRLASQPGAQWYFAVLELLVSPGGRLADLKVHIHSNLDSSFDDITSFSPDLFSEEDKRFIPARANGKPILSRIFLICRVTPGGELDVY
jgi:hypothetical protein